MLWAFKAVLFKRQGSVLTSQKLEGQFNGQDLWFSLGTGLWGAEGPGRPSPKEGVCGWGREGDTCTLEPWGGHRQRVPWSRVAWDPSGS